MSMLSGARRRGELRPGAPVVESTSGTMGIGLAFAGQALGHPVILVGDCELEPSMRQLLRTYGARLELVDRPAPGAAGRPHGSPGCAKSWPAPTTPTGPTSTTTRTTPRATSPWPRN